MQSSDAPAGDACLLATTEAALAADVWPTPAPARRHRLGIGGSPSASHSRPQPHSRLRQRSLPIRPREAVASGGVRRDRRSRSEVPLFESRPRPPRRLFWGDRADIRSDLQLLGVVCTEVDSPRARQIFSRTGASRSNNPLGQRDRHRPSDAAADRRASKQRNRPMGALGMLGTGAVIASVGSAAGCRRKGGSVDRRLSGRRIRNGVYGCGHVIWGGGHAGGGGCHGD